MKTKLLGVPTSLLKEKTAVCGEVAEIMAKGAAERSGADIGVVIRALLDLSPTTTEIP